LRSRFNFDQQSDSLLPKGQTGLDETFGRWSSVDAGALEQLRKKMGHSLKHTLLCPPQCRENQREADVSSVEALTVVGKTVLLNGELEGQGFCQHEG
jgi:hypothetical protein